ncbi:MAG: hypothetical protein RIA63_01790 [Cyclobacteriaceae bacterium]
MKNLIKIFTLFLVSVLIVSCDDEFDGKYVRDSIPEVPIIFEGATTVGFNPYYTISFGAGSAINVTVTVPAGAPLQIKQINNIVAGATSLNVASLAGTSGQYLAAPVAVNGTSYTLSTTIAEWNSKVSAASGKITSGPTGTALYNERALMFSLTMSDDSVIIPVQCRIRVLP